MTRTGDDCEWNPDAGRAAYADEQHGPAELIVGANGEWRLCAACAGLPVFARFRRRTPITGQPAFATVLEVDGDPVRLHGERPPNAADRAAIAEVVRAARAKMAEDPDLGARQEQARTRFAERLAARRAAR